MSVASIADTTKEGVGKDKYFTKSGKREFRNKGEKYPKKMRLSPLKHGAPGRKGRKASELILVGNFSKNLELALAMPRDRDCSKN